MGVQWNNRNGNRWRCGDFISMTIPATKIEKVLIVDDDVNIRLITEMSLEGLTDWKLQLVGSGGEALDAIENDRPDLILLDMMMPDMDGVMVFGKIKSRYDADMPKVIFMTAKVQASEIEVYEKLGAAGVIMKPFDPMTLPEQIKSILHSR